MNEKLVLDLDCCPFCGCFDFEIQISNKDREGIPTWIMCGYCGATSPKAYTKDGTPDKNLISLWNTRIEKL